MARAIRILCWLFVALYAAAAAILIIGYFGLFGTEPTPFAGVFLIPLGLPWVLAADAIGAALGQWTTMLWLFLAPGFNLLLLAGLARLLQRH